MPAWRGSRQFTFTSLTLFTFCYIFLCALCNKNISGSTLSSKITFAMSCRRAMCNSLAHRRRQTKYSLLQCPLKAAVRRKVVQDNTSPDFSAIKQSTGIAVGTLRVVSLLLRLICYKSTKKTTIIFKINMFSEVSQACSENTSLTRIEDFVIKQFVENLMFC